MMNRHEESARRARGRSYGYDDGLLIRNRPSDSWWRWIAVLFAFLLILGFWFALDQKLLFGEAWISETYDNEDWRTNEGNLHTFGAWDLEAHIWKTEYIMEWFPDFHWNPYWYLGMPLLKYYQSGFYIAHWLTIMATGLSAPHAALILVIFAHLLATLVTFLLCYRLSRRIWVSALASTFLLSNTFISLRSYGWEPITVTFLFLFPLGLLLFLKEPLRPFRFWLIVVLGLSYLTHPLLWFSLCMAMGLYLFSIAIRRTEEPNAAYRHYLWQYVALVLCSILIGAVQFLPQISYHQVTSGAHMGVTYLPFYQVPPNIITLKDFFFDAGNLKGPGPIIMIAFFYLLFFGIAEYREWRSRTRHGRGAEGRASRNLSHGAGRGDARGDDRKNDDRMNGDAKNGGGKNGILSHELIAGLAFILVVMVLFYYLEFLNLFPMNLLRSIQYHRIIPEFIVVAAALIAAISNIALTRWRKAIYYAMLVSFVLASTIVVYNVQTHWQTTESISDRQEFLYDDIPGRISMPYTDQSLAVRSSFRAIPQVYGYYEQGITNAYNDELFSVSSGYHNAELTLLYLKAANIGRLYLNTEEGERDRIVRARLNNTLRFVHEPGVRYAYFEVPLVDPSFAQAVDAMAAADVLALEPRCRVLFREEYCGSVREEFVSTDPTEARYLEAYVALLEAPSGVDVSMTMRDPDHYLIAVRNATPQAAIVVKMTYDDDFVATVDGAEVPITRFGPDFMLLSPQRGGDYGIMLEYRVSRLILIGAVISVTSIILLALAFFFRAPLLRRLRLSRKKPGVLSLAGEVER